MTCSKLNRPVKSDRPNKKYVVCAKDKYTGEVKKIHFGQKPYKHNYSEKAWRSYMKRSAGIRDKYGRLTKDNPGSANYWARKILWPGRKGWSLQK
jgi:hypothetical protein